MKFGASVQRLQKQQNFQNNEEGYLVFAPAGRRRSTGNAVGDMLTGRSRSYNAGHAPPGRRVPHAGTTTSSRRTPGSCKPNLTLEYGVRAGYWTNNAELNGLGGYFDPATYDPDASRSSSIPGTFQVLNGVCYVRAAAPPRASSTTAARSRCRASTWRGTSTARATTCSVAATACSTTATWATSSTTTPCGCPRRLPARAATSTGGANYGNGLGLTYDTLDEATLATRLGTVGINTLTPNSFKFPKTHSFSVSYARRIFFNQVVEASYVGTRGATSSAASTATPCPRARCCTGTIGSADLSNPVNRVALDATPPSTRVRPFRRFRAITVYDFEGESTTTRCS